MKLIGSKKKASNSRNKFTLSIKYGPLPIQCIQCAASHTNRMQLRMEINIQIDKKKVMKFKKIEVKICKIDRFKSCYI